MTDPAAAPLVHVPPHGSSTFLSSAWTAREYTGRHASQRRRACNECRQQKLKCSSAADTSDGAIVPAKCSRCTKLGLECKVDESFQRTRKRRRSADFEDEIVALKKQLQKYKSQTPPSTVENPQSGCETPDRAAPGRLSGSPVAEKRALGHTQRTPSLVNNGLLPRMPAQDPALESLDGASTQPHQHELEPPVSPAGPAVQPKPRTLLNTGVTLHESEIEQLYSTFLSNYHPTMPVIDPYVSAQQCCESSPLLFWCIMAVASRRAEKCDLGKLSQAIMDMMWEAIRSVPHSIHLVQAILLVSTWPFPTSSSSTDPTYVLMHNAVSASIQLGLHRPQHQQDFAKYRLRLTKGEIMMRANLWVACNVVAHSVSVGVGLQSPSHLHDWSGVLEPLSTYTETLPSTLRSLLQIELFRHKVTTTMSSFDEADTPSQATKLHLPLYRMLQNDWAALETTVGHSNST
jgi:transcriptional regulatory protein LEU3